MTHASRVLAQLKEGAEDPDTPEEQRERLNERIDELTADMYDLTGFQRDILRGIASLTDDDAPHGLAVKEWLEDEAEYGEVHHGRLYPNLDDLQTKGLVDKGQRDRRTNEYRLTRRGRREIQEHLTEWLDAVGAEGDDFVADAVLLKPNKATDGGQ